MKKVICMLLAMILLASLSVTAFASTPSERIADVKQSLEAINLKIAELSATSFEHDDTTESQLSSNEISPRLPCSQCGGPLKQFERVYIGLVTCERYPLNSGYKDKSYVYRYECNSCGWEEEYYNVVCTH